VLQRPRDLFGEANAVPRYWFNIVPILADRLEPLPAPQGTSEQMALLGKIAVPECLQQEFTPLVWYPIPKELVDVYVWPLNRPRRLIRLREIEREIDTKAELWVMCEFDSPTGSHKINTAVAQCYYAAKAGKKRVITETGAGQWGTAVACAASIFGLDAEIFWVRNVMQWKANRLQAMLNYGAKVHPSPSDFTQTGRKILAETPDHPGDLGIAISEGVEVASRDPDAVYVLGSVLNHVLMHQTVIGLEVMHQLQQEDRWPPDVMISCFGGGSNFGGLILPAVGDMLDRGAKDIRFVAFQSESFPNLAKGEYKYDWPDHAHLLPQLKMYTLGSDWNPGGKPIIAGGLQYHGAAPILSLLKHRGYIEAYTFPTDEKEVIEAGRLFARATGWNLAGESDYSWAGALRLAREAEKNQVIVANLSGRADMEMETYK